MWGEKYITGFLYLAVLGGADVMKQGKCYLVLIHQSWIFFLLIVLYLKIVPVQGMMSSSL